MEWVQPGKWGIGSNGKSITLADLKLKMAEHLMNLADNPRQDEVYDIIAETKVGARKKTDIVEKLRIVFSSS